MSRGGFVWLWRWSGAEPVWWIALLLAVLQTAAGEEDPVGLEGQVRVWRRSGEQPAGCCVWHGEDWEEYTGEAARMRCQKRKRSERMQNMTCQTFTQGNRCSVFLVYSAFVHQSQITCFTFSISSSAAFPQIEPRYPKHNLICVTCMLLVATCSLSQQQNWICWFDLNVK